jgi:hypothetical protein
VLDLATGDVRFWGPSIYRAIFANDGTWVLARVPWRDNVTLLTEKGIVPLKPSQGTVATNGFTRDLHLRADGYLAAIVPQRQLRMDEPLGSWSGNEPHVMVLFNPSTGEWRYQPTSASLGMYWCFSNQPDEVITEGYVREEWTRINGRQVRRSVTGLYRQSMSTGRRAFIAEGRMPSVSRDGRLAYIAPDYRALCVRQTNGSTRQYNSAIRIGRLYGWASGDRYLLWGYNNLRLSVLDQLLGVRCKMGQDMVIGVMDVDTGQHYRLVPRPQMGYGSALDNVRCIEKLSPALLERLRVEGFVL